MNTTSTLRAITVGLAAICTQSFAANNFTEIGVTTSRYSLEQSTGKQFKTAGTLYGVYAQRTLDAPFLERDATQTVSLALQQNHSLPASYTTTDSQTPVALAPASVRLARLAWQGELNDIFTNMSPVIGMAADYESHSLTNTGQSASHYPLVNKALIARLALKSPPSAGYPGTLSWEIGIAYPLWSHSKIGLLDAKQDRDLVRTLSLSYQLTHRLSIKSAYSASTRWAGPSTSYTISGRTYVEQIAATRTSTKSLSLLYAF